ncbi:MAG: site-2 protease family protein [Candidatus Zixiibacteriota bacterium]
MQPDDLKKQTDELSTLLSDLFQINAVYRQNENLIFSLEYRFAKERSQEAIKDRLKTGGYNFKLHEQGDALLLSINPERSNRIPALNIILFLATLFTVYFVPVFYKQLVITATLTEAFNLTVAALVQGAGLVFTLAMISILFVHEMGHFIAGRRRQIITSWPYFIPAPNIIGTFGAIIKSKSPFWNRRDLIEVGAAGPIAGWIVAIGWLIFGLSQSSIVAPDTMANTGEMVFALEGESILMRLATLSIIGPAPQGQFYLLSEAAFAGWVGLLVTAINLLPIGQLDGGHILYGLFRARQKILATVAMVALLALGFQSPMWWFFAAFGLFFGVKHPPTLDDGYPVSSVALGMAVCSIVIMILSFTPVPFR